MSSLPTRTNNFANNALTWENKGGDATTREIKSFPSGLSTSAIYMPLKYGGMRVTFTGTSSLTANIEAPASISTTLTGSGTVTDAKLYMGRNITVNIQGGGTLSSSISAKANMSCTIRIGANPSAFDIAQAIWGAVATQYSQPGTMGEAVNNAGTGGVQPAMLNTETGDIIIPLG